MCIKIKRIYANHNSLDEPTKKCKTESFSLKCIKKYQHLHVCLWNDSNDLKKQHGKDLRKIIVIKFLKVSKGK